MAVSEVVVSHSCSVTYMKSVRGSHWRDKNSQSALQATFSCSEFLPFMVISAKRIILNN